MTTRTVETKEGKKWVLSSTYNDPELDTWNLHALASDLAAKYIGKAPYIRSIKRRNNYDGTQTYTVTYDNCCRSIYVTDIY